MSVCRVCLDGSTKLNSLENKHLINLYEKMVETKFNSEDARSRELCCFCYQKLLRSYTFSQMAHRSENIFTQIFHMSHEATYEHITELNIERRQPLSVATMPLIIVNTTNERSDCTSNDEPVSVKEEETEEDQSEEVEFESSQDYTKNRLTVDSDVGSDVDELSLYNHVERAEESKLELLFICKYCNTLFYHKQALLSHIRKSHSDLKQKNNNSCNIISNKKSISTSDVERTIRIPTEEKLFTCHLCNKSFTLIKILVRHMKTHTSVKSFACDVCKKKFRLKYSLTIHMRIHTGVKPFACDLCDKKFTVSSHLKNHKRTHINKPFACNICSKQFRINKTLICHMKTHTGEEPFSCNVCDKKFSYKNSLVEHTLSHTDEQSLACKICNKRFNYKRNLIRHEINHSGEKPYACNACNKKFIQKSDLVRHRKTHTSEKPFSCNMCGNKFKQNSYLDRHRIIHAACRSPSLKR